jgi:hypothetical protein
VAIPDGHAISGIILVDQVRSVSWEKRYVKMAGVAPVQLLDLDELDQTAQTRCATMRPSRKATSLDL